MKIKGIKGLKKLKKKRSISIAEINTLQTAYFKKLTFFDYFKMVGLQGVIFSGVIHFLFFYTPVTIVGFFLGICFGLFKHLPNMVKKNYHFRSYSERNRLLNNFTQLLVNPNMTLLEVLEKIIPRLEGELYNDMAILLAKISTADDKTASSAFEEVRQKYKNDIVFCQYFDQLETVFINGTRNIESFKELKFQHNKMIESLRDFQKVKHSFFKKMKFTYFLVGVVLAVLIFAPALVFPDLGVVVYKEFAHNIVGMIAILIYLLIAYGIYVKILNFIYDDSITTL